MPLDIALEVAEEVGLPLMAISTTRRRATRRSSSGCGRATSSPTASAPSPTRRCAPRQGAQEILAARARGVIFDIGHGGGSFGFGTTRAMLAAGFLPDVISSDVHVISIEGPAFDLLTTMSKFLCLGVRSPTVIALRRSTRPRRSSAPTSAP